MVGVVRLSGHTGVGGLGASERGPRRKVFLFFPLLPGSKVERVVSGIGVFMFGFG